MSIGRSITKGIEKIFSVAKRRGLEEEEKRQLIIENITKELSKFSKEDLEKITMLAETTRAIQKKDAKAISEFISKSPKEKLDKITSLAETTKDFKEKDVKAIAKFVNIISKENVEKIEDIAGIVEVIQEKDAKAIFEFISKAPKGKLEKIAILAGIASTIPGLEEIKIPSGSVIKFDIYREYIKAQEIQRRLEDIEKLSKQGKTLPPEEIKRIRKEIERMGLFSGIARVAAELERVGPGGRTLSPDESALSRDEIERIRTHEGEVGEILEDEEIETLFRRGIRLLKVGRNNEAYDYFNKIIFKNPKLKSAWLNKGVAVGKLGDFQEEIDCYKRALEIDKNYAKAVVNLLIAESFKSTGGD